MSRSILHCDCNSFFASVETTLNPEYKNVPMAVCGDERDRHGIVLAKNELAKKYNIQTAETVYSAKKKCPSLVIAKPHHDKYIEFSRMVGNIYARFTDMVEPFGIDESWLDVTASQRYFGSPIEIAEKIRATVKNEIGITVSIGVSFNKVFAKLGSDYKKPDAITVIDENNFKDLIFPLPVSSLLFVGRKSELALSQMGIHTIGELAGSSRELLVMKFGKSGELMHKYANGLDDSPVLPLGYHDDAKSVGNGFTFRHDLCTKEEWRAGIDFLAEDVGRRLRKQDLKCSTVQVTIKDEYLRTIQRQRPQDPPSDISAEIADTAYKILVSAWPLGKPVRMLTVTATNLLHSNMVSEQLDLFSDNSSVERNKKRKSEEIVDKIRQKYGKSAIVKGTLLNGELGILDDNKE